MELDVEELRPALEDLGLERRSIRDSGVGDVPAMLVEGAGAASGELRGRVARSLAPDGVLLVWLAGARDDRGLAAWRDALWPLVHVVALYRFGGGAASRATVGDETDLGRSALVGTLLVGRRREWVQAPRQVVEKFDANARGWDGQPGTPGYPHHRWMRRFVGLYAPARAGARILDFGCGAGWCGIEAAKRCSGASLAAFDPSPAMVERARANALAEGVLDFTGRTGFGEDPPFARAGEEPFDLVISSGVISFSPDPERWLDGLARTVRPGGTLVVGDIQRESIGFRRRRREKPLLPVRELNASTLEQVRTGLVRRGFRFERGSGYQLTWPVPELAHLSETRLRGALTWPLLWTNQLAAGLDRALGGRAPSLFDSWVMRLTRGA